MLTDNGPTDDDLAAYTDDRDPREYLQKLADAATSGPWEAHGTSIAAITGSGSCRGCSGLVSPAHEPSCYWSEIAGAGDADAEFIASARTAVPALLDALAAAEARIDAVRELLNENPTAYAWTYNNNIRSALDGDA